MRLYQMKYRVFLTAQPQKKTVSRATGVLVGLVIIILLGSLAGYIISSNQPQTYSLPNVTISSVNINWNGQVYSVIPFSSPSGTYGAIISFSYTNNGQGFSPSREFSISSLTDGFNVQGVIYYVQYPSTSGYSPTTPPAPVPSAYQQSTIDLTCGTDWSANGHYVGPTFGGANNSIIAGCTIYVSVALTFPNTAFNGVLTLLASES
jgi:hypothetical protein